MLRVEITSDSLKAAVQTPVVIPMPLPPPERRYLMNTQQPAPQMMVANGRIRVVTYNVLAPIYATQSQYPYCDLWALSWNFRKHIILRELSALNADILCLQEVQTDQYESFLLPNMKLLGYEGLNKQKTREALGPKGRVDGCAIFFKAQKFSLTAKFVIEFNDAAINMAKAGKFSGISAEQASIEREAPLLYDSFCQ